ACSSIPFLTFFFNHTPPPQIYPLSLHDALPICTSALSRLKRSSSSTSSRTSCSGPSPSRMLLCISYAMAWWTGSPPTCRRRRTRSEEHTSELQSRENLVCRLLLEKKKKLRTKQE